MIIILMRCIMIEEPQYIIPQPKPKVGIRFYFGTPRRYYGHRNNHWAIDPPWWVKDRHYRR